MDRLALATFQCWLTARCWFEDRIDSDRGASAVEYGLLVGLIAAVIVVAVGVLGGTLKGIFTNTNTSIVGAA